MEVLPNSALSNNFFNFPSLSSNSNKRLTNRRTQHRFSLPISKFPRFRTSILRVSARFGEPSRRRNSLRKKIIGDENFRIPSDPGTKTPNQNPNFDQSDDVLAELSSKDKILPDSNLLNELEDWVTRYKKEAEYWGIGSNPIFTVHQDSLGNMERVEVDEEEILSRSSSLEDVESVRDKVLYAKKLAEQMENGESVIHKDSSLVKFVSCSSSSSVKEEVEFVSSIQTAILRLDLVPKLPAIGRAVLCGYIGLWLLKTVFVYRRKSDEVDECSALEKEMMRRKMKAWKEKEVIEKGTVEVLQEEELLVSFEKPKFDREGLMSSISKVKGSEKKLELLDSSQVESGESMMEFNNKIDEIKTMARRAREIEAGIELKEKENHDMNKETGEDDEDISMRSQNSLPHSEVGDDDDDDDDDDDKDERLKTWTESDQENTELSGLDIPVVNGSVVDSGFPNHEIAASDAEKVVPLAPTEGIIQQTSDVSKDKLSMMNNSTGRKSRVIRSVKEAKEFLSTRSSEEEELTQKMAQDSDEIFPNQRDEKRNPARRCKLVDKDKELGAGNGTLKSALESTSSEPLGKNTEPVNTVDAQGKQGSSANKIGERETSSSSGTEHIEKEQSSEKENWMEKHYQELEPIAEKMRAGFRDNYMAAREKETQEPGTIAEIAEIYRNEDNDELEWMKDEKLRDIVFHVRDNELAGRDPFHLISAEDKAMFLQGLEKKVEKENEKLSHLHQWIHSNVENLDYGVDGISVYDPPEKVRPRWKGAPPTLEKNPEFINNYNEQREALFSGKAASVSPPVKKEEQSSLQESSQSPSSENTLSSSSEVTSRQPKIVVEGSDGSVRPGKKSGKEFWQHTKKWSPGFLEMYNAETDPEVKAVMRDMGKDLDRWITEDEIKDVADIMEKLPERNKQFMEKKLNKVKREMELFGPQAVLSKYREYGEDKEEDYLWWLDLPHVLCLELYTVDDKGEQQVGFYTLEMAADLELEPKPHHVIAFENAADCKNLCYIIQAHLDMLRTGNVFIVPRPPKDTFREAKANGFGVTVIRKGELKLNIDEPLEEVEEQICEIGSKMYHDKIMGDRSVDISSLMKGVFNLKTKPSGQRTKRLKQALKDSNKKSS
ncbi:Embryo defective 1703 [Hirschfeldia incana]|nr:Embryo defective 1703 [Hirschfeldia incana]